MKRNTLVVLLAAAIEMQVVTGCRAIPEMQRFVLVDGTVIVADTGADGPSKETTEIFKRLYAAVGSDADIDDAQTRNRAVRSSMRRKRWRASMKKGATAFRKIQSRPPAGAGISTNVQRGDAT